MQVSLGRSVYLAILTPQQFLGSQSFHHLSLARVRKPCDASQPSARQRICNPPTVPLSHQQCACNICSELSHEAMSVHDGRCVPSLVRFSCNVSLRTISQLVSSMRTMTKHSLLFATAIDETARYDLMLARERSSPNSLLGSELDASNEPFVSSLKDPTPVNDSLFLNFF